jgi:hypothetical protein
MSAGGVRQVRSAHRSTLAPAEVARREHGRQPRCLEHPVAHYCHGLVRVNRIHTGFTRAECATSEVRWHSGQYAAETELTPSDPR